MSFSVSNGRGWYMLDWCIPIKTSLAHHEQKLTVTSTQPDVFSKKFLIRDESFSLEYLFTNSTNTQSGVHYNHHQQAAKMPTSLELTLKRHVDYSPAAKNNTASKTKTNNSRDVRVISASASIVDEDVTSREINDPYGNHCMYGNRLPAATDKINNKKEMLNMKETNKNQTWGPVTWNNISSRVNYQQQQYNQSASSATKNINLQVIILIDVGSHQIMHSKGEDNVLNRLDQLLQSKKGSDVDFMVQDQKISAHSLIIQGASPILTTMFDNATVDKTTKSIEIKNIEPKVFQQLLQYLYTGDAPGVEEETMTKSIFLAAEKFQLYSLMNWCSAIMSKKINVNETIHLLIFAHMHSATQLQEDCLDFIVKNKATFWPREDFKQLSRTHADLFFEVNKRMNAL